MVDQGELDTMGGEGSAARPAAARRTPPGAFRGTDGRSVVVGLDLGGTKLRGAIGDAAGAILHEIEQPTHADSPAGTRAQLSRMVRDLAIRAGLPLDGIAHIVVGVPGVVDPDGQVGLSPNVAFDAEVPLSETLAAELGRPVSIENDGNLSAYGEYATAGDGTRSLAFLAIGTGVGMGLIIDSQIVRGRHGGAGEIAFVPFGTDPFAAADANPSGAFEAAVGSAAIRATYAARTGVTASVRNIFDRAAAGEPDAKSVIDATLRGIAIGLGAVVALLDPGRIVIGGGIGARPGVAEALGAYLRRLVPSPCEVVTSRLGARAGVVGALAYARAAALQAVATEGPDA